MSGRPHADHIRQIFGEFMGSIREFRCASGERLVRAGVSMTHLHLMWILEHHGELPMSRLADIVDVSVSNATGIVDRMEERGLVERIRVPDDRRVVIVRITERGRDVLRQTDLFKEDLFAKIVNRLDDAQQARLAMAMADLRDAAGAVLRDEGPALGFVRHHVHAQRPGHRRSPPDQTSPATA